MDSSAEISLDPTPLVGVLGGMGPAATVDFYSKLIAATPAATDQDHLRVMIWSDPTIPDRSRAIAGEGEDPTPALSRGAQQLKDAGAAFYVVACNGAHAFLPAVREQVDLPYLSIVEVTADYVAALPHVSSAGLLATDATLSAELYQNSLEKIGLRPVIPSELDQVTVMDAIYGVKAGTLSADQRGALEAVAQRLVAQGADVIIAACTEIPLALTPDVASRPLVDPAVLLANQVVLKAKRLTRPS